MSEVLTPVGYEQTKLKLAKLEKRLAALTNRGDLSLTHLNDARRSCERMIGQYRCEIKLFEAAHREATSSS